MIQAKKYFAVLSALLIGFQLHAKENKGMKKAPVAQNKILANCEKTTAQLDLSINNVRARVLNGGDLWWNYNDNSTGIYEVPSGSGKNSIYAGALWIAGYDLNGNLKVAAQTYRQTGANDFWAGPIAKVENSISVSPEVCSAYDKFWALNKSDVETYVASGVGGASADAISTWPGNGNVANGELPFLAPFFDADNNGLYQPGTGDYPYYLLSGDYAIDSASNNPICNDYLFGDRTIWWVFNDVGNIHTETNSQFPIGLEIRAQAFAFVTTDQINNMTFYKYEIINRSSDQLNQTYFGQWCDPDLGDASDDFVGCDVGLGLGYVYNGDADDGTASGYGANPPALGIDFFQGPLADAGDGVDNDRDGETDEAGEQIIMSRFVYYKNDFSPVGNPQETDDYYQYLSGKWKDGVPVTYGGDGRGTGPGATTDPCNFMFPGTTDDLGRPNWTMSIGGLQPDDMRFLQSAGTFTLMPGAVNYITTGVVWAQSIGGGPQGSLELVKIADAKAQALFDACFKVLSGPDAPNLSIRELDKEILLTITNTNNKKTEGYYEVDPTIPLTIPQINNPSVFDTLLDAERRYSFEGYKIYQLKDATIKSSDLNDNTKAKIIAQFDIKNDIGLIINYEYNSLLQRWTPVQTTEVPPVNQNLDKGLTHSLRITTDLFESRPLVNYRPYYFMVVSYAYNNFRPFDYNNTTFTQSRAYVQGAGNTKAYSAIPHKPLLNNMGTVFNATWGEAVGEVKRIEGTGNGGNVLDLSEGTENEILNSPDHLATYPVYKGGKGPISLTVFDPMILKGGSYAVDFEGINDTSKFDIYRLPDTQNKIDSSLIGLSTAGDHVVDELGVILKAGFTEEFGDFSETNGFIEATATFGGDEWLTGIKDVDGSATADWIRSGIVAGDKKGDSLGIYENLIDGTWAPYALTERGGAASKWAVKYDSPFLDPFGLANSIKFKYLNSVDVVITNDKSKWTRSVVFETGDTLAQRFNIKSNASVNKDGVADGSADATLTSATGMGWFPGYAINIETGERLNIAFGENSADLANNGNNMVWDPTSDTATVAGVMNGGRHYIYIFNAITDTSFGGVNNLFMPRYDLGAQLYAYASQNSTSQKRNFFRSCIWTSIPLVAPGQSLRENDVRVRLRVAKNYENYVSANAGNVVNGGVPYYEFTLPASLAPSVNNIELAKDALDLVSVVPNPYYAYSSYERTLRDQLDNRIRFINLPSRCTVSIFTLNGTLVRTLKRDVLSDVSAGSAVEAGLEDENLSSTLDWDLSNTAGIKVSSGVYLIHIDAGELGEKVIKWFGIMRPIDLDTF